MRQDRWAALTGGFEDGRVMKQERWEASKGWESKETIFSPRGKEPDNILLDFRHCLRLLTLQTVT